MKVKKTLLVSSLILGLCSAQAFALVQSGWSISSSYIWRLVDNADNTFNKGSDAKFLQIDRRIKHRQAVFKVVSSMTNKYDFKVGCMFQSPTPAYELDVSTLDISITDQSRGYVFARFLVDNGQEYSLRGQIMPPSRIIFAPFTQMQAKKISDLFLQLGEGGRLSIALLQGKNRKPRVYEIPLEGFFELSNTIIDDCVKLNRIAQNHRGPVKFLPDYLTKEPADATSKDYTLKPKKPTDGSSDDPVVSPQEQNQQILNQQEEQKPKIKIFEPGGGVASIGEDGKPITRATVDDNSSDEDNLGEAKAMQIGDDGKPIGSGSNKATTDANSAK